MEIQEANPTPKKKTMRPKVSVLKKINPEAAKLLQQLKERANKKAFGRKIRDSEIITAALKGISEDQIRELQEATYTQQDRLHMAHEEFVKNHGKLSLDEFIGKLMRGEIQHG